MDQGWLVYTSYVEMKSWREDIVLALAQYKAVIKQLHTMQDDLAPPITS
jgi:hypothetical protein